MLSIVQLLPYYISISSFPGCPSPQVHKSRVMWVGSRSSLNISPSVQLESPSSSDLNPRPLWYFYVWCNGTNLGVVIIYLLIYLSPLGGTAGGCTILVKHCTDNICTVLHQHSIGGWFLWRFLSERFPWDCTTTVFLSLHSHHHHHHYHLNQQQMLLLCLAFTETLARDNFLYPRSEKGPGWVWSRGSWIPPWNIIILSVSLMGKFLQAKQQKFGIKV